jgi:hypothetical protein
MIFDIQVFLQFVRTFLLVFVLAAASPLAWAAEAVGGTSHGHGSDLDDTGGFIHLAPGVVHTNNGCSQFQVSVRATLTNAHVFGLRFHFEQSNLELLSVTPGSDTTLHILPEALAADTLHLDGFFSPNFSAGTVTLATMTIAAIAPEEITTQIGFIDGQGFSGTQQNPEPIVFTGDTTTVFIDGTRPGSIHLTPSIIHTNNGCSEFSVAISAGFCDARNFDLSFGFDQSSLELLSVTPGSDTTLHLLPELLGGNVLHLDGFFHPNKSTGLMTLATLTCRAIAPADITTQIPFVSGQGYSGTADNPVPIDFSGDTATVVIDGTLPLAPDSLVIITLPYPSTSDSVRLQWRRVRRDMHGNPVVNPLYHVYLHDVINDADYTVASLLDTFIYDEFVHITFPETTVVNIGLYEVRACKTSP